jgi:hypothetical protein
LAVGKPSARPLLSPCSTGPSIANGRVSSRVAVSQSPSRSASRTALLGDRSDGVDRDAIGVAEQLELGDVAAAVLAEGEVLAGRDAGGADPADQPVGDEVGGGDRGEIGVELEDEHRVGAGGAHQPLALLQRGQPEPKRVRAEIAHRMGIEGRDQHRPVVGAGARGGAGQHRLVALVETVEIAERDDAAA